jgi:hypothetical protein
LESASLDESHTLVQAHASFAAVEGTHQSVQMTESGSDTILATARLDLDHVEVYMICLRRSNPSSNRGSQMTHQPPNHVVVIAYQCHSYHYKGSRGIMAWQRPIVPETNNAYYLF